MQDSYTLNIAIFRVLSYNYAEQIIVMGGILLAGFIVSFLVGAFCVALGISNMRGNLSTIHEYHRRRVTEENRLPFGRLVGSGTILCGGGIMAFSILSGIYLYLEVQPLLWTGSALLGLGLVGGLGLSFYGMIKYNKGIF